VIDSVDVHINDLLTLLGVGLLDRLLVKGDSLVDGHHR